MGESREKSKHTTSRYTTNSKKYSLYLLALGGPWVDPLDPVLDLRPAEGPTTAAAAVAAAAREIRGLAPQLHHY